MIDRRGRFGSRRRSSGRHTLPVAAPYFAHSSPGEEKSPAEYGADHSPSSSKPNKCVRSRFGVSTSDPWLCPPVAYDPEPLGPPAVGNLLICCLPPREDLAIDI